MEFLKSPVTALEFHGETLLAGVGSYLKVYDLDKKEESYDIIGARKIFKHHVIHGIKCYEYDEDYTVIYGGREWSICQIILSNAKICEICILFASVAQDWIWDIIPVFSDDKKEEPKFEFPPCVALALGHNSVLLHDWAKDIKVCEVDCEVKCILYSAHFIRQERPTWGSLVLCSGTVFNQVVIWAPGRARHEASSIGVLERIQAHDGVIFDMNFDLATELLVTASDDRSIRVWKCESLQKLKSEIKTEATICLCKLYGHESRVWRAKIIPIDGQLHLVSIGEDGCCIVWNLTMSSEDIEREIISGKVVKKMRCHKGRNIWSLAMERGKGIISTGGGDGGIRKWNLRELIDSSIAVTSHRFEDNIKNEMESKDLGTLKSIHLCSSRCALGHTDAGALLRFDISEFNWLLVNYDPSFKSYAVMRVCDETNMVALGNTKGEICILQMDTSCHRVMMKTKLPAFASEGKVHNMTWYAHEQNVYLFASGPNGEFVCCEVILSVNDNKTISSGDHLNENPGLESEKNLTCQKIHTWTLPQAKHRWHMDVTMVINADEMYVVCGDRRGSLHLFHKSLNEPLHTLHGIHEKNGVTSVQILGCYIVSTGRDGIWRKIKINFDQRHLEVLAQNRAAQGMEWLEGVSGIHDNGCYSHNNIIVFGFHGRNFTAWSNATGDSLFSIECGGGHRDWSFKVNPKEDKYSILAFLKAGVLHTAKIPSSIMNQRSVVEASFHGGQITCVKCIETICHPTDNTFISYLVTGSEDTKLMLSAFLYCDPATENFLENKLQKILVIDDHISSVRAVTVLSIKSTEEISETILISGGGRATINCYCIRIQKNSSWQKGCEIQNIVSHCLGTEPFRSKQKRLLKTDPETRYMALTAWKTDDSIYVAAACSDAAVRVFLLNVHEKSMRVIGQSTEHNHCFLTISHVILKKTVFVIAGATDGFIYIWDIRHDHDVKEMVPCLVSKCHMSGINAMDILEIPVDEGISDAENSHHVLIATGGDDNAIQLKLLRMNKNNDVIVVKVASIPKAHSTQITGLKFLNGLNQNVIKLVSVSIDQRMTNWSVSIKREGEIFHIATEFRSSTLTNIADVSSMDSWKVESETRALHGIPQYFAVCGQGIEILVNKSGQK